MCWERRKARASRLEPDHDMADQEKDEFPKVSDSG